MIFYAHHGLLLLFKEQKYTLSKNYFLPSLHFKNILCGFVGGKGRIVINYMSHQKHNWALYFQFHPLSRFKHPHVTYYDKEDLE